MRIPSLLRAAEYDALSAVTLSGSVLDLGGSAGSGYQRLFKGTHIITTLNLDTKVQPDIFHDLETPLPIAEHSYEGVLLINVLEHVFNYRQLLSESVRVLKPGGTLVVVVPFLFPVHPSPNDYHRFTKEALERYCEELHLGGLSIVPLGTGVFAARYLLLDRLLPGPMRAVGYVTLRFVALLLDKVWSRLARGLGKKYNPEHYALGYCLTVKKL